MQPGQIWQPPIQQGPGWQQAPPPPRRKRSPLPLLALSALVLVGLLAYTFLSGPLNDVATNYQNEDYQLPSANGNVPELPIPQFESEIASWLENNTVYEQQLASPVRCDVDPIASPASVGDNQLQARMREYVACLTRVWGPALESAGHTAYQPTLFVYPAGEEVTTSCGTQPSHNAFYCGADQNLYLAADILDVLPPDEANAPETFDLIIAHEFGHAMQGRTGVFAASSYAALDAATESEGLEVFRRVELQADCFAGAVMNSVAESTEMGEAGRQMVARISYEIGDDRLAERFDIDLEEGDHGIGENRKIWVERGLAGPPLSGCNTFTAVEDEVR